MLLLQLNAMILRGYYDFSDLIAQNAETVSKGFDESTDLIRGLIALRSGVLRGHRNFGDSFYWFDTQEKANIYSKDDLGLDATTKLLIQFFPSTATTGFNAQGTGSIEEIFTDKSDVIKISATLLNLANEVRKRLCTKDNANENSRISNQGEIDQIIEAVKLVNKPNFVTLLKEYEELNIQQAQIDNRITSLEMIIPEKIDSSGILETLNDIDKCCSHKKETMKNRMLSIIKMINDYKIKKRLPKKQSIETEITYLNNTSICEENISYKGKKPIFINQEVKNRYIRLFKWLNSFLFDQDSEPQILTELRKKGTSLKLNRDAKEKELIDNVTSSIESFQQISNCFGVNIKKVTSEGLKKFSQSPEIFKLMKLFQLALYTIESVKLENLQNNSTPSKNPYYRGYTNDMICAYVWSVCSEADLDSLSKALKKHKAYDFALAKRLLAQKQTANSWIPWEPAAIPISNAGADFNGSKYQDCVETTLRHLFLLLFTAKKSDSSDLCIADERIPSDKLKNFFVGDPEVLANDGSIPARDKWSVICSNQSGILYVGNKNYELKSGWDNVIRLFCLLMKDYPDMIQKRNSKKIGELTAAQVISDINNHKRDINNEKDVKDIINSLLGIREDLNFTVNEGKTNIKGVYGNVTISPADSPVGFDEHDKQKFLKNNTITFSVKAGHAQVLQVGGNYSGNFPYNNRDDVSGFGNTVKLYQQGDFSNYPMVNFYIKVANHANNYEKRGASVMSLLIQKYESDSSVGIMSGIYKYIQSNINILPFLSLNLLNGENFEIFLTNIEHIFNYFEKDITPPDFAAKMLLFCVNIIKKAEELKLSHCCDKINDFIWDNFCKIHSVPDSIDTLYNFFAERFKDSKSKLPLTSNNPKVCRTLLESLIDLEQLLIEIKKAKELSKTLEMYFELKKVYEEEIRTNERKLKIRLKFIATTICLTDFGNNPELLSDIEDFVLSHPQLPRVFVIKNEVVECEKLRTLLPVIKLDEVYDENFISYTWKVVHESNLSISQLLLFIYHLPKSQAEFILESTAKIDKTPQEIADLKEATEYREI